MKGTAITLRPVDFARLDAICDWLRQEGVLTGGRKRSLAVRYAIEVCYLDVQEEIRVRTESRAARLAGAPATD